MDIHATSTKRIPRKPSPMGPCERCGNLMVKHPSRVAKGGGKYCSRECADKVRRKHPLNYPRPPRDWHGKAKKLAGCRRERSYNIWHGMKQRCLNPKSTAYPKYGGAGVTVCDRWLRFVNFYQDMGDPPDGKSLDRIDPYGNYEPGNCRWATAKEQCNNFRHHYQFRLDYKGQNYTLQELADKLGLDRYTLRRRVTTSKWPEDMWHLPPDRKLRPPQS